MSTTWNVCLEDGVYAFCVTNCNNEKNARSKARMWLGVDKLPSGTMVWRWPEIPDGYDYEH